MKEFRRQVDSALMTDGTGVHGIISANSWPTITLGTDGYATRLLRIGQKVNIYDTTLATNRTPGDERQISSMDEDAKTITLSGAAVVGLTNGDKIVASGLNGANPVGIFGVPYHHNNASSGTWLGLSRSTYPEIRAGRITASGSLALSHPRRALNKIGQRLGMENGLKLKAWMHPCQIQAYEELGQLVTVINKTAKQEGLDLFFDVQQLAGVPAKKHFNWDKTRIDYVVDEVWGRAEMKPAGFYEEEGRKLFEVRGPSGGVAAATLFYLVASFNTFINNPPGCVYVSDLTVPSGY
jgi:hypothetical protein